MFQIPIESHVAHVSLKVAKLELMRHYYQQVMGLVVRQESKNEVRLGTATQDLVILKDHPQGQAAPDDQVCTILHCFCLTVLRWQAG